MLKVLFVQIIFLAIIGVFSGMLYKALQKEDAKAKSYLKSEVIIDKDTLIVVDYSLILSTYTLSNGAVVDKSFVIKEQ
jgi:hypothetical protein